MLLGNKIEEQNLEKEVNISFKSQSEESSENINLVEEKQITINVTPTISVTLNK